MVEQKRFGEVWIVFGMQFGSEGKGAITSYLCPVVSVSVRSGASNAGHTIYFEGEKFIMRQLPSGWINPVSKLVIGRESLISLEVLLEEINEIEDYLPVRDRLYIDEDAHVITESQKRREMKTNLSERIGSTSATSGEGIGTAQSDKVMRKESCVQVKDVPKLERYACDTVDLINSKLEKDQIVLLEGTQGHGLSLDYGFFPYVTSRNVTATAIASSVGISTHEFPVRSIGVTRTYPIRVGGNSGPFGSDSEEITWDEVSQRAGAPDDLKEKTTVTKKVRRIATFSEKNFMRAVRINRPTELAVTFTDYLDWSVHGQKKLTPPVIDFLDYLEEVSDIEVSLVKTGPETTIDFDNYRRSMIRKLA